MNSVAKKPTSLISKPWFRLTVVLVAGMGLLVGALLWWRSYLALNPVTSNILELIPDTLPEAPRAPVAPIDTNKPITNRFVWPAAPQVETSVIAVSDESIEWWDIKDLKTELRFRMESIPTVFLRLGDEVLIYGGEATTNETAKLVWHTGDSAQILTNLDKGFKITNIHAVYPKQTIYFTAESNLEVVLWKLIPGQPPQALFNVKSAIAKPTSLNVSEDGQFAYFKTAEPKCYKLDIQLKRLSDLNCAFFPYDPTNIAWELRQNDTSLYFDTLVQLNTKTGKEIIFLETVDEEEFYQLHNLEDELVMIASLAGKYGLHTVSKANPTVNNFVELTGVGLSSVGRVVVTEEYVYQATGNQLVTWERANPQNSSFLNIPNCISGECNLQIVL